ncbi:unnamed protein product, partial [marine sediment metagenome]
WRTLPGGKDQSIPKINPLIRYAYNLLATDAKSGDYQFRYGTGNVAESDENLYFDFGSLDALLVEGIGIRPDATGYLAETALKIAGDYHPKGLVKGILPLVGVATGVIVVFAVAVRAFTFGRRVYQDGQYLISVRYPGQWHDLREFVQPDNPDVLAAYFQYGPDPRALYDWVCRNIDYRRDIGEFWQTPSETLKGIGDCEDTS